MVLYTCANGVWLIITEVDLGHGFPAQNAEGAVGKRLVVDFASAGNIEERRIWGRSLRHDCEQVEEQLALGILRNAVLDRGPDANDPVIFGTRV